jgi:hypothetical protein
MWLLDSRVNELPTVVAHVIAENDKILVGRDNILKEQYLPKDTLPFVYWVNSISESTFLINHVLWDFDQEKVVSLLDEISPWNTLLPARDCLYNKPAQTLIYTDENTFTRIYDLRAGKTCANLNTTLKGDQKFKLMDEFNLVFWHNEEQSLGVIDLRMLKPAYIYVKEMLSRMIALEKGVLTTMDGTSARMIIQEKAAIGTKSLAVQWNLREGTWERTFACDTVKGINSRCLFTIVDNRMVIEDYS